MTQSSGEIQVGCVFDVGTSSSSCTSVGVENGSVATLRVAVKTWNVPLAPPSAASLRAKKITRPFGVIVGAVSSSTELMFATWPASATLPTKMSIEFVPCVGPPSGATRAPYQSCELSPRRNGAPRFGGPPDRPGTPVGVPKFALVLARVAYMISTKLL